MRLLAILDGTFSASNHSRNLDRVIEMCWPDFGILPPRDEFRAKISRHIPGYKHDPRAKRPQGQS